MDYNDGTIFDSDPTACEINYKNPLMMIKCYTTTAGRGINISADQLKQFNSKGSLGGLKTSVLSGQSDNFYFRDANNLSDQIQRAAGMSYCNQTIERNFLDLSGDSLKQFEDVDEPSASSTSDPTSDHQSSQPVTKTSPTKRKTGRREFRKVDVKSLGLNSNSRSGEKKFSDVFKQNQSFDPAAFMAQKKTNHLQLGSKSEFPTL